MFAFWSRWKESLADKWEAKMEGWGWSVPTRDYTWHAWALFMEQIAAIIPISVFQARRCQRMGRPVSA